MVILSSYEIDSMIQSLDPMRLDQVGSSEWMQQGQYLDKLKVQACRDALSHHDEVVIDTLIGNNKIPVLISRLLVLERWRESILPNIIQQRRDSITEIISMKLIMILFQESTICSIIVIAFYQQSAIDSALDILVDLTDYCYRRFVGLNSGSFNDITPYPTTKIESTTTDERIRRQVRTTEFALGSDAISLIRFITDRIDQLPLSIVARILNQQDMVLSLIAMMDKSLFTRREEGGKTMKFSDQTWSKVDPTEQLRLTRLEGNLWIAIYNFVTSPLCRQRYELNEHRRTTLLKLKRFFNEVLVDQLPMLEQLWRTIEQLSMTDSSNITNEGSSTCLMIEQVPEIFQSLQVLDFVDIAAHQLRSYFQSESLMKELASFADQFDDEDYSLDRCDHCQRPADKRCSICKSSWFCSRKCQVEAWPKHRVTCHPP